MIGPIVGAFLVNGAKTMFTAYFAEYWLFLLGAMFVLVTLYLPDGVVRLWRRLRGKRSAAQKIQAATGEPVNAAAVTPQRGAKHERGHLASKARNMALNMALNTVRIRRRAATPPAWAACWSPASSSTSHGPILYLEDLTVQFDGFRR